MNCVLVIVRLCQHIANLEFGMQFPDSESVQRNLEIVQIPRLRGTYIPEHTVITHLDIYNQLSIQA